MAVVQEKCKSLDDQIGSLMSHKEEYASLKVRSCLNPYDPAFLLQDKVAQLTERKEQLKEELRDQEASFEELQRENR